MEKTYRRVRPGGITLRTAGEEQGAMARALDPLHRRYRDLLVSGVGEVLCYAKGGSKRFVLRTATETWLMGAVRLITVAELLRKGFVLTTFDTGEEEGVQLDDAA